MVQVQQQYAVNLTLPLTLPAAGLADAQAQAAAIATGTNTSALLATALAAGLISGTVHASHPKHSSCTSCMSMVYSTGLAVNTQVSRAALPVLSYKAWLPRCFVGSLSLVHMLRM